MPQIFVRLAFGEPLSPLPRKINPLPPGLAWIRGMDKEPILTTIDAVQKDFDDLDRRRSEHLPP